MFQRHGDTGLIPLPFKRPENSELAESMWITQGQKLHVDFSLLMVLYIYIHTYYIYILRYQVFGPPGV